MKRSGFSIIEILATLVLAAMLSAAVLEVLNQITRNSHDVEDDLTRQAAANFALDRLCEDITMAADSDLQISIENAYVDGHETSQLTIAGSSEGGGDKSMQIDWLAVARYDEMDMVLFRRQLTPGKKDGDEDVYVPLCEGLNTFLVLPLDVEGEPIEIFLDGSTPDLLEVTVELFRTGIPNPDRVVLLRRTMCLDRFGDGTKDDKRQEALGKRQE